MRLFPFLPMGTILVILYVSNIHMAFAQNENQFIYNGFLQAKLHLDGSAKITSNGLLQLTNTVNNSYPQDFEHNEGTNG
ncbi:l-type lectin-domain containing receptor kinase i.3 [Quercus suber]|uniref:L-type lectin-domain containing receptor kinase i.3 n=1 Tax=Quercus suber TaxID=58331 RepID=A0AAW0L0J8_QUESU